MNTESVIRTTDEGPPPPLVEWYPPAGPLRALPAPIGAALGALALGALVYAGFAFARSLHQGLEED